MTAEEKMWAEIRSNHGLIRVKRTLELDVPRRRIRHLVDRGVLERVHRGLLAATGAPKTWLYELSLGVQLAGAPNDSERVASAVCGLTAAVFLEFARTPERPIHILSTRYLRPLEGYVLHRTTRLPLEEIVIVKGIPTTDPLRTFLDVASSNPRRAEWLYLNARRRGLFTKEQALERVEAESRPGRGGLVVGRAIVEKHEESVARTRSNGEVDVYEWIREAGLPLPERNVRIPSSTGSHEWEIDLLYRPQPKIAIDYSPFPTHGDPETYHKDGRKRNDLIQQGYRVLIVDEETDKDEFIRILRGLLEE